MSSIFFLLFVVVVCGSGSVWASARLLRSAESAWPLLGLNLCETIVHYPTKRDCIACFIASNSDWVEASGCVDEWLPPRFAKCVTRSSSNEDEFEDCIKRARTAQRNEIKRAEVLYNRGGKYMKRVGDSDIIPGGAAAIYSCMAQELLLESDTIKEEVKNISEDCFDRFEMDPVNQQWHLGKGKRLQSTKHQEVLRATNNNNNGKLLVFEYGYVGHDMPFHGIGPFAVDIMKGKCIFKATVDDDDLDTFVSSLISTNAPVPAWIFREILDKITDITLP